MTNVVIGPFELEERIGRGGMGDVWRARHHSQGSTVAVKVITSRWAREDRYARALRAEAEAVARLHHPNIVGIWDVGTIPYAAASTSFGEFQPDSPFLVMQYVDGGSLRFDPNRTWTEIRSLLLRLLDALAHAHARNVIHRDLKPANVLVAPDETPLLTDFGLAHVADRYESPETSEHMSAASGTPRYMAPEQILGEWRRQGPWTDLYSFGCLAHFILTGRPPFEGSVEDVFEAHLTAAPPELRDDGKLPEGLGKWIATLLAKHPPERFRRAADAMWALGQLDDSRDIRVGDLFDAAALPVLGGLTHLDFEPTVLEEGATTEIERRAPRVERSPTPMRLMRSTPPPIPPTWERPETVERHELPGVGMGIYSLRTPPLVGRKAERDIVWGELVRVHEEELPAALVLRGDAGTGKSRLAEWIGERAQELGAATLLRAVHSPMRGAHDGLGPMVANHLGLSGLSPSETFERIRDFWLSTGATASELQTCEALTRIVIGHESDEVPHVKFTSPAQRWAAITDFLRRVATERPVFLWLDDVQWGADALGLAQHILAHSGESGAILVVLTVRNDALLDRPQEAIRLEQVTSSEGATTVHIRALNDRTRMQLVRTLLGLDTDAARQVASRTGGNPLFAVQLVGDWIERGLLELGTTGYRLGTADIPEVPDDIHTLWTRRVTTMLDSLAKTERTAAAVALEVGAALGQDVAEDEWRAVLAHEGITAPRHMIGHLVSHRLARRNPHGWSFAHGMLRESVERSSRAQTRWRDHHLASAEVLSERLKGPALNARVGDHYFAAQAWRQALEPLLAQAVNGFDMGEYESARDALDRVARAADAAELPEDAPARIRALSVAARIARETRDLDEATALVARAEEAARSLDEPELIAETLGTRASLSILQGDLATGRRLINEGLSYWEALDNPIGHANALRTKNWLLFWSGRPDEAEECLHDAATLFARAHDDDGLGWVNYELAALALHAERTGEAARLTERASGLFERVGNVVAIADVANMRGEIARMQGELQIAENWYREALAVYGPLGHTNEIIARENLGLTLFGAGRFEEARETLEEVLAANISAGRTPFVVRNAAELLGVATALDDRDLWNGALATFEESLLATEFADLDTALALEDAAERAAESGAGDHAVVVWDHAATVWERLGREEDAAAARERGEHLLTTEVSR